MGSIKRQQPTSTHDLTEAEFNYIMNVNQAKQNIVSEYDRVISAFLHYIAGSRLGYTSSDNLEFKLDFQDPDHTLEVKKI